MLFFPTNPGSFWGSASHFQLRTPGLEWFLVKETLPISSTSVYLKETWSMRESSSWPSSPFGWHISHTGPAYWWTWHRSGVLPAPIPCVKEGRESHWADTLSSGVVNRDEWSEKGQQALQPPDIPWPACPHLSVLIGHLLVPLSVIALLASTVPDRDHLLLQSTKSS